MRVSKSNTSESTVGVVIYDRPTPSFSGELTSLALYDEGWHYANGTYNYPEQNGVLQRLDLSDSTMKTLVYDNVFSTKERYTDNNGLQLFNEDMTIDHLTGLMWKITGNGSANHANRCLNAFNSTLGGFTDWRVCNLPEIMSVANRQTLRFFFDLPYMNVTSTTFGLSGRAAGSTNIYEARLNQLLGVITPTTSAESVICRTMY